MSGSIIALIISLMMIAFVIYKGNTAGGHTFYVRKAEFLSMTNSLPDDCIIQVWIGRNTYEQFKPRENRGRDLRNYISE